MGNSLSIFLAFRYIRARQIGGFASFISASSTIGIAIGVMVLIIVLSAMNGFERALSDKLLSIIPHGELIAINEPISPWEKTHKHIETHPNVLAAAPLVKLPGMMQFNSELKSLEVRAVSELHENNVSSIKDYIVAGAWQYLFDKGEAGTAGVVVGQGVADKLGLSLGDQVQLLVPNKAFAADARAVDNSQAFQAPQVHYLELVGIFKFGGVVDDTLAYVSLAEGQRMLGLTNEQAQGIRIKVDNVFSAPSIVREVAYGIDHYVYIHDWTGTQGHLYNDIQLVRMVMFIVMVLVIAVASFNIVSTLIMIVNEKRSDIAILKTMGATSSTIMSTFVIQGMVNGLLGSLSGAILGGLIAKNLTEIFAKIEQVFGTQFLSGDVYFVDYLPTEVIEQDIIVTVVVALVLSTVATIYPAWRATKVEPAEVLGQS